MSDIQFAPLPPPPPPAGPPDWLVALMRWLDRVFGPLGQMLGQGWSMIEIALIVLAVGAMVWVAVALLYPLWRARRRRPRDADTGWMPDRAAALALLEDADRLAAEGRFDEAAHLLLQRSVGQIAQARPDWLAPSSTAREIGAIAALPAAARRAFGTIAALVERSLFGLRRLSGADWQVARTAYADFALADLATAGRA